MDNIASTHYQNPFIPQRHQQFSQFVMKDGGLRAVNTELDYRNAGIGKDMDEDGPCAVVKAPIVFIQPDRQGTACYSIGVAL